MTPGPSFPDQDERLEIRTLSGRAEAILWWTHVPPMEGHRLGVIGGFSCDDPGAAAGLLAQAKNVLRGRDCTLAVGPMDGNTWRRYRLVTDAGSEPPFFLEPTNPSGWVQIWRDAGFSPLAEYFSSVTDDLTVRDERLTGISSRMKEAGLILRPLNPSEFQMELERIYEVSVVAFRSNYLYTPLPREAFLQQYRLLEARIDPRLVLLAECEGRAVGYVFALPDLAEAQRGVPVRTVIVKTLAILPERKFAGLGALLLGAVHDAAHAAGFTRAIHALMHESNRSRNLSARYARTVRRYTLFSCPLRA